jgi:hypothetical protein
MEAPGVSEWPGRDSVRGSTKERGSTCLPAGERSELLPRELLPVLRTKPCPSIPHNIGLQRERELTAKDVLLEDKGGLSREEGRARGEAVPARAGKR